MNKCFIALGLVALSIGLFIGAGCETETANENDVRISPSFAQLGVNQSQRFSASGGFNYTWALSNEDLGFLTSRSGSETTYISRSSGNTNGTAVTQVLTVTSTPDLTDSLTPTVPAATGTVTRTSGFIKTAEAVIAHQL